jgi:lipopolysaccharide biosynthesis glycosyltransferase
MTDANKQQSEHARNIMPDHYSNQAAHRGKTAVTIACSTDNAYALPLSVMLKSLAVNADPGREIVVYIVDNHVSSQNRERIAGAVESRLKLRWCKPGALFPHIEPEWGHVSAATYDKLFISRLLPEDIGKALWLDSDTLVLDDICILFDTPMKGESLLAVQDPLIQKVSSPFGVQNWKKFGLSPADPYFNAGVLLVDVESWRDNDIAGRALTHILENGKRVFFYDQEALNVALAGKWTKLNDRWNYSANAQHAKNQSPEHDSPSIVHFSGGLKPWVYPDLGELQDLYFQYVDQTGWKGSRPEDSLQGKLITWYIKSSIRKVSYPLENIRLWLRHRLRIRNNKMNPGEIIKSDK